MFTGIIEKTARVKAVHASAAGARLSLELGELAEDVKLGDSIAVNGACLTASAITAGVASFDVVAETLRRTTLGSLAPGDLVNVERALRVGDRLGGHFVQGHVDGVGTIAGRTIAAGEHLLHVSASPELLAGIIEKGSIAVDGISLTIASLDERGFTLAIIPHTLEQTTLSGKREGSRVNLELDMIGKYVRKLAGPTRPNGLSESMLREHGF